MEVLNVPQQALVAEGEDDGGGAPPSPASIMHWWLVSAAEVRRVLVQRGVLVASLCGALCDSSGWHDAKEVRLLPSEDEAATVPVYRMVRPEGRMAFTLQRVMACSVEVLQRDHEDDEPAAERWVRNL